MAVTVLRMECCIYMSSFFIVEVLIFSEITKHVRVICVMLSHFCSANITDQALLIIFSNI